MTNKEAIRRILDHKRVHSLNEPRAVLINEALDLAIKALEERPQGEWIVKQERAGAFVGDRAVYSYTCPFCKVKEFYKYPFCHCGADMRGKTDA